MVVGRDDAFVECIRAVRHTCGILRHKQNLYYRMEQTLAVVKLTGFAREKVQSCNQSTH